MNKREVKRTLEKRADDLLLEYGNKQSKAISNTKNRIKDFMLDNDYRIETLLGLMSEGEKNDAFHMLSRRGLDKWGFLTIAELHRRLVIEYVSNEVLEHLCKKYGQKETK